MSLVLADRVRQTTTSTGTGTITLDGSVDGFQSFAVIGNNNTTYYTIAGGTQWEVGIGTYFSGTLARTTIISSSTGSILNLAAGVKDVFVTLPAENTVLSTSPALTSPSIDFINDTNGNEILNFSPTTSAVDYLTVKNGIGVGVPLHVYADGTSANIGLHIQPKGTGLVTISDGTDFNKGIRFRSSSSAASAITLLDAVSTAGRVVTLPDATTTLVGRDTTDTLTNKTLTAPTIASANLTTALTLAGAAGTNGQVLTSAGSGLPTWTTVASGGFTLGTPVATTSGTSIDFTGIPAGVKQIVISFNGVSTNGTSEKSIQLGDAGGIETSGYNCTSMRLEGAGISPTSSSGGFEINSVLIGDTIIGSVILTLENSSSNTWAITGVLGHTSASQFTLAGRKPLSAVLDRVRLTTAGGVNTFDAGEINIAYI